jgi:hypothetical protein
MTKRTVSTLANIAGAPSDDGKATVLSFKMHDGQQVHFGINVVDLPTVIASMLTQGERAAQRDAAAPTAKQNAEVNFPPVTYLALSVGTTTPPNCERLHVRAGHFELGFDIPTEALVALATQILPPSGPRGRN